MLKKVHKTGLFTAFFRVVLLPFVLLLTCCPPAVAKHKITLILIPLQSPSVMYGNFLPLKRYLEERLGEPVELKVANKRSDVIGSLKRGEADLAFLCPTLYCTISKLMPVVPLAKLRVNGSSEYRSVLLVRNDSDIKKTADLVDRTFVYGRYYCPGSGLLPKVLLQKVGINDGDFMETVKLGSDESAILAVMARLFDATGVSEMAARPYLNKGVRIIGYSYPIPQYLFAARAGLGRPLLEKIRKAMTSVNSHDPQKVLGGIEPGADGLVKAADSDYDIVRILMNSVLGDKDMVAPVKGAVRFVVEPVSFGPEMFKELNSLMIYLSGVSGRRFQLVIPENIEDFLRMVRFGEGDFFLQNHHLFSIAARRGLLSGIASLSHVSYSENRGVIIVSSASPIRTLSELDGKKIGVVSLYSDSGFLAQKELLGKNKVPAGSIHFVILKSCERVIMQVYQGAVAGGFVSYSSFLSMGKDIDLSRFRVLAKSPTLPDWVIAVRKDLDAEFAKGIEKSLIRYSAKDPAGPGDITIRELRPAGG